MPDEVVELSVDETNKLRAELGLAPLRIEGDKKQDNDDDGKEVLELSVNDSNVLRARLGLAPLRADKDSSSKKFIHAPAGKDNQQAAERIAQAKLQRQVEAGLADFEASSLTTDAGTTTAQSWAQQMRDNKNKNNNNTDETKATKKARKKKKGATDKKNYETRDLQGMHVAHAVSELQEGETTVMTLVDAPLLATDDQNKVLGLNDKDDSNQHTLENVALAESRRQADGLRKKRQLELGAGHAGGYAGFDDDEFEELGGTGAPSLLLARGGGVSAAPPGNGSEPPRGRGFQIGAAAAANDQDDKDSSNLFSTKVISLESTRADVTASDFLTREEDEALNPKKKKKKAKFKKKDKKDKKKKKKRVVHSDDDEEEEEQPHQPAAPKRTLLEELEETAVTAAESSTSGPPTRKRRRDNDERQEDTKPTAVASEQDRRAKYHAIMERGNERTQKAFGINKKKHVGIDEDEEPDDAFLNAALDKARRLNRLKALQSSKPKGASAVLEAVQSSSTAAVTAPTGITFAVDETREFTRALRARGEQKERARAKQAVKQEEETIVVKTVKQEEESDNDEPMEDLQQLAQQVQPDNDDVALDGTTGTTVAVGGRGVGNVLSFLQQTGEMTLKNAGKEEMRGRAKDKKTYEDYEALDLSKVVRIDPNTATEKDKELAQREIKLEYRDKHGRLLTRKEAFRDLCYQFHGHGSGKRKEEKRLEQIAREQAEARLASRQAGVGTFGALKATQKATGKAFVVHKTQS